MSVSMRLSEFLDGAKVPYEHHVHPTAFTAQDTAESMHIPSAEMAKSVVIKADGQLILAVVPANRWVDLDHLKFTTRSQNIGLAAEHDFKDASVVRSWSDAAIWNPVRSGNVLRHIA